MKFSLNAEERQQLRRLQRQRRDEAGYVKVTVLPLLDAGWSRASVAEALGLDETTVYRYGRAFTNLGLAK